MTPLLSSLGIYEALDYVAKRLREGEFLFAFLDDVDNIAEFDRIKEIYDIFAYALHAFAGNELNEGEILWNRASIRPLERRLLRRRSVELGRRRNMRHARSGLTFSSARTWTSDLLTRDARGLRWQNYQTSSAHGSYCPNAQGRAQTLFRTLHPSESPDYARAHDDGAWECRSTS